jgi:hypothetical protein
VRSPATTSVRKSYVCVVELVLSPPRLFDTLKEWGWTEGFGHETWALCFVLCALYFVLCASFVANPFALCLEKGSKREVQSTKYKAQGTKCEALRASTY